MLKHSTSEITAALLHHYTEFQEVFKRFKVVQVMSSPADVKDTFNAHHRSDDKQAEQPSDKADESTELYKAFDEFIRVCGHRMIGHALPTRSSLRRRIALESSDPISALPSSMRLIWRSMCVTLERYVRCAIAVSGSNSAS